MLKMRQFVSSQQSIRKPLEAIPTNLVDHHEATNNQNRFFFIFYKNVKNMSVFFFSQQSIRKQTIRLSHLILLNY